MARVPGVFLWVLLTFGGAPAHAQSVHAVDGETVRVDYLAGLKGVTFCRDNGRSFAFVRLAMTVTETAEVMTHEAKHLEQHRRYPDCKSFMALYRTPRGMLELEAEAFSAGYCRAVAMGADSISLQSEHLWVLATSYVPGTNLATIAQTLAKYRRCA
jgi:hypothetical protein